MKIPLMEKIGYGLGDTASNFVWAMLMSWLMFFYTDIFGITAIQAGLILLIARASDGVADFLMGALADRTRTRWGKFRPYLLWMCVPLGVIFVLSFTTPDFSIQGKLIYAWITHVLLMFLYTAINIPYSALSGVMTDDPHERTSLNSYRMALAQVGGIIVNFSTLPLVALFAGGAEQAKAKPIIVPAAVKEIKVIAGGKGYDAPPRVTIIDDVDSVAKGTDAKAHAVLKDGAVASIELDAPGRGYSAPKVWIDPPPGSQPASAAAELDSAGALKDIKIIEGGKGYQKAPKVAIADHAKPGSKAKGAGAKAHAVVKDGAVVSIVIDAAGKDYVNPKVTIETPPAQARARAYLAPTAIESIEVTEGGKGYDTAAPNVIITDAAEDDKHGDGAIGTAILKDGVVTSIKLDSQGSGYLEPQVIIGVPPARAKGFQITIAIFAGMAVVLFLVTFATTRERIQPLQMQKTRLVDDLGTLFRNRHWVVMFITGLTQLALILARIPSLVYYLKYYVKMPGGDFDDPLKLNFSTISAFMTFGSIFFIVGASSTAFLVGKIGKKYAFMLTMALTGVFTLPFFWIEPDQIWLMYFFWFLGQVVAGMNSTLYWSMIADTADFSEWKFNVRTTGIVFSATTCSQKIGMGIGGWLTGIILAYYGYQANVDQTDRALYGILLLVSFIPAIGFLFLAAIFSFYGLTEKVCDTMRADLNQRRRQLETSPPIGLPDHPGDVL